ncbi:MAG: hypothetical protein R3Y51_06825 [Rikenellaceae bacterium]
MEPLNREENAKIKRRPGRRKKDRTKIQCYFESMTPETVFKYNKIYTDYKKLRKDIYRDLPEVARYINKDFYYTVISKRHNISKNYMISILKTIAANENLFQKTIKIAYIKLEEDD